MRAYSYYHFEGLLTFRQPNTDAPSPRFWRTDAPQTRPPLIRATRATRICPSKLPMFESRWTLVARIKAQNPSCLPQRLVFE